MLRKLKNQFQMLPIYSNLYTIRKKKNSHFYQWLQKGCSLLYSVNACNGLNNCNWDDKEKNKEEKCDGHNQPPDWEFNKWNCEIRPINITRLWSPLGQPYGWVAGLLSLSANSGTPSGFERDKCCRHYCLRIIDDSLPFCNFL